jgi:hypothetical protein
LVPFADILSGKVQATAMSEPTAVRKYSVQAREQSKNDAGFKSKTVPGD